MLRTNFIRTLFMFISNILEVSVQSCKHEKTLSLFMIKKWSLKFSPFKN